MLLHLSCMLLLAVFVLSAERPPGGSSIQGGFADEGAGDTEIFDTGPLGDDALMADAADAGRSEVQTAEFLQTELETEGSKFVPNPATLISSSAGGAGSGRGAGGSGGGGGKGTGTGPAIRFLGTEAEGRSFVFIVDSSQSMRGQRFERALAELRTTIWQLEVDQEFFVVLFNDEPIPMLSPRSTPKMVTATRSMRTRAWKWIKAQKARGHTHPIEAFNLAMSLEPDVIFFLTDGEIPPETQDVVKQLNSGSTVIHTIAFENEAGGELLRAIAAENRGRYRFVE